MLPPAPCPCGAMITLRLLLFLGGLAGIGSLATQMVVPALPAIANDLNLSSAAAQKIVSVYLLGLAVGQLGWGPLTEAWGRRRTTLVAMLLFTGGSLLSMGANSLAVLLIARLGQAIGASGALIASRAIIADKAPRGGAARAFATLSGVTLISPVVAPSLGGLIAQVSGWREIFALLAAISAILLLAGWIRLAETSPANHQQNPKRLLSKYREVFRHGDTVRLTLATSLVTAGMFHFLTVTPFLFTEAFALNEAQLGLVYLAAALAMAMSFLAMRFLTNWTTSGFLRLGARTMGIAVAAFGLTVFFGRDFLFAHMISMLLFSTASGLLLPSILGASVESFPEARGIVTSLVGCAQMTLSTVVTALVSPMCGDLVSFPISLAAIGALALAILTRPADR